MDRKTTKDFPQELLDLYDEYVHGQAGRRGFLDRASSFAVGGKLRGYLARPAKADGKLPGVSSSTHGGPTGVWRAHVHCSPGT